MQPIQRVLRVAAVWGETVLGSCVLKNDQAFAWKSLGIEPPDGFPIPQQVIRNVGSGWELDPRGARDGYVMMRGRREEVSALASVGAPIGLMAGDVALLQYGQFALFAQPVTAVDGVPVIGRIEPWIVLALCLSAGAHGGLAYTIATLSTPTPVQEPLELDSEDKIRERLVVLDNPEMPKEKPTAADNDGSSGSGVKDPGMHDKKDMGGGKKIAGAAGALGVKNKTGKTQLAGDTPGVPAGSLADVLGSGQGAALSQTLQEMKSVSALVGGLGAKDFQLGGGSGFSFKGAGPGGGGKDGDVGVPFGSGTMNTGIGPGSGGGGGKGGGGISGKGTGGPGKGGSGGGDGSGAGGEKKVSAVGAGGGGSKNFSADEIRRVVMAHMGAVRMCYELELDKNPGLKGSVTVTWHISASGAVTSAGVASNTLGNDRVAGCITRNVKGWVFKNPDAIEAQASWGYVFSPPK